MHKTQTVKIADHHYLINNRFRVQINCEGNYVFISDNKLLKLDANNGRNAVGYFNLQAVFSGKYENIISAMIVDSNFQPIITRLVKLDLSAFA